MSELMAGFEKLRFSGSLRDCRKVASMASMLADMTEDQLKRDGQFGRNTLPTDLHNIAMLNFAISGDVQTANRESEIMHILLEEAIHAKHGTGSSHLVLLRGRLGLERAPFRIEESPGESALLNDELRAKLGEFYTITIRQ
jgi:hypothetical protein